MVIRHVDVFRVKPRALTRYVSTRAYKGDDLYQIAKFARDGVDETI